MWVKLLLVPWLFFVITKRVFFLTRFRNCCTSLIVASNKHCDLLFGFMVGYFFSVFFFHAFHERSWLYRNLRSRSGHSVVQSDDFSFLPDGSWMVLPSSLYLLALVPTYHDCMNIYIAFNLFARLTTVCAKKTLKDRHHFAAESWMI